MEVIANDIVLCNMTVYRRYDDSNNFVGYRVAANAGYVIYDTTDENYAQDDPESEPYPVIYYYTAVYCTPNTDFNNFTWVAVLRSGVDENYIFGGGTTPPLETI